MRTDQQPVRIALFAPEGRMGKAIGQALGRLGFQGVGDVRQGKFIELELKETDPARARSEVDAMRGELNELQERVDFAERMLANPARRDDAPSSTRGDS